MDKMTNIDAAAADDRHNPPIVKYMVTRYHRWEEEDGAWEFDNFDDALNHFKKILKRLPATHAVDITATIKPSPPEQPGDEDA